MRPPPQRKCAACGAEFTMEHRCPRDPRVQLADALSLLRDLEYGSRHLSADGVLVPCCPDCDAEKGQAHSVGCRVDGMLRRSA